MTKPSPNIDEIRRYARGALQLAGATDATLVPLADVEAATGLFPAEALYDAGEDLPPKFRAIAARLKGRVLGGLSFGEKRIYLDHDQPYARRRFIHGHELGHSVLPWQHQAYHADDDHALDPETRDLLEAEANAFSAELLFGVDRFTEMTDANSPSVLAPLRLTDDFGVSAHAALRRYAETTRHEAALLVIGRRQVGTQRGNALPVLVSQCVQSSTFEDRHGSITDLVTEPLLAAGHPELVSLCLPNGPRVIEDAGDLVLDTKRGATTFSTQAFTNRRVNFVIIYRRKLFSGPRLKLAA